MPSPTKSKTKSKSKLWIAVIVLVASGFAAYRNWPETEPIASDAVRRPTLAILVFDNLDQLPDMDFLSTALTRETTDKIGQLYSGRLDVIAHGSVVGYRGSRKSLHQVGRELQVDYLVEGGVRKEREDVHLSIRLTRISDEAPLWTEEYKRSLPEVYQVQNEIIERIGSSLGLKPNPADMDALNRIATFNEPAREAYLRGVDERERASRNDYRACIASFEQAIKADSKYARAYAALADAELHGRSEAVEKAEKHARQAIELTSVIPQSHFVLGEILYKYRNDDKGAQEAFDRAIALNQSDADAHFRYAEFLLAKDRIDEALLEVERMLDLDPFSLDPNLLAGRIYTAAKMYDRAIHQLEKTITFDRNSPTIRYYVGQAYLARSMNDDAIREFQRAVDFGPGVPEYIAALGEAYAASNKYDEARAQLAALKELAKTKRVAPQLIDSLSRRIKSS